MIGGISAIAREHGWASDNVRNYEVRVLLYCTNILSN